MTKCLRSCFLILFSITLLDRNIAEFYFSNTTTALERPSYLFKRFPNVTEDKFPYKIEITFSLSSFNGMLLLSLDHFANSLLLKMRNKNIIIYYNEHNKEIRLVDLCNCKRKCLYEKLTIVVLIKDRVKFQCNNRDFYYMKLNKNNGKIMGKPYIIFNRTKVKNQGLFYIINHEQYPFRGSYETQLIGCIFQMKYNDELIKMEKAGPHVEEECPRRCSGRGYKDLCNDGECIETYSKYSVLCNCKRSIYNGPKCNESIPNLFLHYIGQQKLIPVYEFGFIVALFIILSLILIVVIIFVVLLNKRFTKKRPINNFLDKKDGLLSNSIISTSNVGQIKPTDQRCCISGDNTGSNNDGNILLTKENVPRCSEKMDENFQILEKEDIELTKNRESTAYAEEENICYRLSYVYNDMFS